MMHGHEKSDPAIVAVKPANKAEQPAAERSAAEPNAAEPVEQRAGTKGNADQQSTCRTQSRASVSQALERIRKVARERKKERFTALFHHINTELLEEAFYELAQNAAPGVDRLTWKDYEADLERNIEDLHDRVQRGAYRALPSRRVYIPKAGRPTAPARGRRSGGQDRPTGGGLAAECDLRKRGNEFLFGAEPRHAGIAERPDRTETQLHGTEHGLEPFADGESHRHVFISGQLDCRSSAAPEKGRQV